ncbi:hypothetical protein C8R42DRAFT_686871 [Lentinula raphanica]|nr:hypothetical protein C8R42DRAFT_686871 [Lentinula raphanica]
MDEKGKHSVGDSRLFRILVSESAYLIWKIRCEQVIQGKEVSEAEAQRRWKATNGVWTKASRFIYSQFGVPHAGVCDAQCVTHFLMWCLL